MIGQLFELDRLGDNYRALKEAVRNGLSVTAFGLSFSQRCLIAALLPGSVLVFADELNAKKGAELIGELIGRDRIVFVPARDEVLLYKKGVSDKNLRERVTAYTRLASDPSLVCVTTATALIQRVPRAADVLDNVFTVSRGDNIDPTELAKKLVSAGYKRTSLPQAEGEFSVRGDITDIFPVGADLPVRLDFFDTEIEFVKVFDPSTQVSAGKLNCVRIYPATDVFLSEADAAAILSKLSGENAPPRLAEIFADVRFLLENNRRSPALSYVLPMTDGFSCLADYLSNDRPVLYDEPKQIEARLEAVYREHMQRFGNLSEAGEVYSGGINQLAPQTEVFARLSAHPQTAFQIITSKHSFFQPRKILSFKSGGVSAYRQNIKEFETDLKNWRAAGYDVVIAGGAATADNIAEQLGERGISAAISDEPRLAGITVCRAELSTGFIIPECRTAVIGTYDIITARKKVVKRKNKSDVFVAPSVGDYVVHTVHGIGICRGIKQLDGQFGLKDFVVVEYSRGDMLYVPIDQMDLLSRYSGAENPRLSKIGGKEFERLKAKVKESIREMALDLHKLYLERSKNIGHAFSPDTELQREFEERFPHSETDDQLRAAAEIKRDMESSRAMDRLLCGDVGYGKTEVAFRAVFKAVTDGKQAAMLAPTTILSEQHYHTALSRFDGFGVRIEVLNRFKSDAECADIVRRLKDGKIDFIIGTHRLLSADVAFCDLGLLVVDEEQRFGVEHKEKIKSMKCSVDVLSMSATPIPRTLHMSMTGIRDISILETPPQERLPVQSYIIEETDAVVADALEKELARGGQAFVMINRVERIDSTAAWISRLVPEAKVVRMHGRMSEQALESAVYSFYNNESNVLVCTTIIENGIDLPNANTLIILDSDKLGLSQLYQLRGRVGRSNRLAYCYFTYREGKVFSEEAYKRLTAIMEFTDFGSGFKIAMRDLEIRGAGDVLGSRQHGHMDKVGYDMYVRLLKECVDDLRGAVTAVVEPTMDVQIAAFVDEDYIADEEARMRAYREIAETDSFEDRDRLIGEFADIYGRVPQGTVNLVNVSLAKKLAARIGAETVTIRRGGSGIVFADNTVLADKRVMSALADFSSDCILTFTDRPVITFKTAGLTPEAVLTGMLGFLKVAASE